MPPLNESERPFRHTARITSLDGIRGLAAITVVLSHIHGVLFTHHMFLDTTPLRIFWAGGEAVILFFVLSGFVLSAPVCHADRFQFSRFMIARIIRIYVPYLCAIALCLLASEALRRLKAFNLEAWRSDAWSAPIDWSLVASHVGLVGNFDTLAYDKVIWSLVHEMRFSIVFPLYLWLLRNLTWKSCLLVTGALSVGAALATVASLDLSAGFRNGYPYTAHYLLFFMFGGLLAKHIEVIASVLSSLTRRKIHIALAVGLGLYAYGTVVFHSFPAAMHWEMIAKLGDFIADWATGCGSIILIAIAVARADDVRLLQSRALQLAGRYSYSLYLIHLPALTVTLFLCGGLPQSLALTIALPVIAIATVVFHHFVEAPAHRFGKARTAAHRNTKRPWPAPGAERSSS